MQVIFYKHVRLILSNSNLSKNGRINILKYTYNISTLSMGLMEYLFFRTTIETCTLFLGEKIEACTFFFRKYRNMHLSSISRYLK